MTVPTDQAAPAAPGTCQAAPGLWNLEDCRRLAATLKALPDLLFVIDSKGCIRDYHAPRAELLLLPPEQFLGRTLAEVLPAPTADRLMGVLERTRTHGPQYGVRFALPLPDHEHWHEASIALIDDPQDPEASFVAIVRDIHEQKQTEDALRTSEARLEQIARQCRLVAWEMNAEGLYTYMSPVVEDVLGYRPEEIVGKLTFFNLLPAPQREAYQAAVWKLVQQGEPVTNFENPIQAKDGRVVWVSTNAEPLLDADGTLQGYRGSDLDITERKQAEVALRASELKYRELHETMRDAFGRVDMDGRIQEFNSAFLVLTGHTEDELRGLTFMDLTPPRWHAAEARIIAEQVIPFGYSDVYEKELIRHDGVAVPVELRTVLLRDADGRPAGMWASVRDITDRREMQQALRDIAGELERRVKERTAELEASREALAGSEALFRQLAESMQDVFWMIDARTQQVLYVSPAFESIWGRPRTEERVSIADFMAALHPEDRARMAQTLGGSIANCATGVNEYRIVRPDGTIRWIEDHGWLIHDAEGRVVRVAGVARDITGRHLLEAGILQAAEDERQRIGRDLHDSLGQSLTGIAYLAEALRERLVRENRPEAAEIEHLAHLIEEVADKSHALARGLLLVDLKRGSLAGALQELAFRIQELFQVECRYEGLAEIDKIDADVAGQLYRIAQEAATNAAKHGKTGPLTIGLAQPPEGLLLSIRDPGPGLTDPLAGRRGLGLDIMRHRASLIGATFSIQTQPGRGTTVQCLWPRSIPPPEVLP